MSRFKNVDLKHYRVGYIKNGNIWWILYRAHGKKGPIFRKNTQDSTYSTE